MEGIMRTKSVYAHLMDDNSIPKNYLYSLCIKNKYNVNILSNMMHSIVPHVKHLSHLY